MKVSQYVALATLIAIFPVGCGGVSNTSTLPRFAAPVAIKMPDNITFISGVSPSGKMVGRSDPNGSSPTANPFYWSSPTATPVALPKHGSLASWPTGINNNGNIIGEGGTGISIFWDSPTTTPTVLPGPPGLPDVYVKAINHHGQMVGSAMLGGANETAIQWDSKTSVHTLPFPSAEYSSANFIADDGSIYGSANLLGSTQQPTFWASGGATGEFLPYSGTNLRGTVYAVNAHTGNAVSAGLTGVNTPDSTGPIMWDRLTHAVTNLPTTFTPTGVSDDGTVMYSTFPGAVSSQALVGKPASTPALLNSVIPPGTGWDLKDAVFQLADGSVIGRGSLTVNGVTTDKWFYAKRTH